MVNRVPVVHVFTATQREANAVRALVHHKLRSTHSNGVRSHWTIDDTKNLKLTWKVFVSHTRMLNVVSALEVAHSTGVMPEQPDLFLYVACAGAIRDDVKIGDVVIPSKVGYYEPAKEAYDREEAMVRLIPRIDWIPLNGNILDVMSLLDGEQSAVWKSMCFQKDFAAASRVHIDHEYISGEKVIASRDGATYKYIQKNATRSSLVDMESYGALRAANRLGIDRKFAIIRGISDSCGDKNSLDPTVISERVSDDALSNEYAQRLQSLGGSLSGLQDDERQRVAVTHAAAYAVAFCRKYLSYMRGDNLRSTAIA